MRTQYMLINRRHPPEELGLHQPNSPCRLMLIHTRKPDSPASGLSGHLSLHHENPTVHSSLKAINQKYCAITQENKLSSSMSLISRGVDHVVARLCFRFGSGVFCAVGLRNCRFVGKPNSTGGGGGGEVNAKQSTNAPNTYLPSTCQFSN